MPTLGKAAGEAATRCGVVVVAAAEVIILFFVGDGERLRSSLSSSSVVLVVGAKLFGHASFSTAQFNT